MGKIQPYTTGSLVRIASPLDDPRNGTVGTVTHASPFVSDSGKDSVGYVLEFEPGDWSYYFHRELVLEMAYADRADASCLA